MLSLTEREKSLGQGYDPVAKEAERKDIQEMAKRFDEGKSRVDLIEPKFILGTGNVLDMGSHKYGPNNWKKSLNTDKHDEFVQGCRASLLRHALAAADGPSWDSESNLSHMYHVACNAMFIDYYQRNKTIGAASDGQRNL